MKRRRTPTVSDEPLSLAHAMLVLATLVCAAVACGATANPAVAQDRTSTHRARMEVSLLAGYGGSSEGGYAELGFDARLYSPDGAGLVLRAGGAAQILSVALAVDVGVAYRVDLVGGEHAGLQLAMGFGPTIANGPFDRGNVWAGGGWAALHLDYWYRNMFVGLGASSRVLVSSPGAGSRGDVQTRMEPRTDPVWTVTPTLRFGGEWGL